MTATSTAPKAECEAPLSPQLAVPVDRLLQDWKEAYRRALLYLEACGVADTDRDGLAREAVSRALQHEPWSPSSDAVTETLQALRALLPESRSRSPKAGLTGILDSFLAWRLGIFLSSPSAERIPGAYGPLMQRGGMPTTMPPLSRRAMVPEHIERRFIRRLLNRLWRGPRSETHDAPRGRALRVQRRKLPWIRVALRRRVLLAVLVLIPSVVASGFMVNVLPHQGRTWIETAIVVFFGVMFGWISIGFWTATLGFFTLIRRRDRFAITALDDDGDFRPDGRTAIVMPICDEPVERVFAGLKAIYQSLECTGAGVHFDFFLLSDSSNPSTWVKEEAAWAEWCRSVNGFNTIFYRRRRVRVRRKSGNVADFCRRWGTQYGYMIMLDADSVMAGTAIVELVRMMEPTPTSA